MSEYLDEDDHHHSDYHPVCYLTWGACFNTLASLFLFSSRKKETLFQERKKQKRERERKREKKEKTTVGRKQVIIQFIYRQWQQEWIPFLIFNCHWMSVFWSKGKCRFTWIFSLPFSFSSSSVFSFPQSKYITIRQLIQ